MDFRTLKRVLKVLASGDPLLVFPENLPRSVNGQLGSGKKGIGLLLAKSQATVIPARVIGGHRVLGKGMLLPRMGRKLIIKYGNPIPMSDLDPGKSDPERYETISSRVLSAISSIR